MRGLPKFLVFSSRTESEQNHPVFAFSLWLVIFVILVWEPSYEWKWILPFVDAIVTLYYCIYLMQDYIIFHWTVANI
jgi:hypothetical protein